MYHFVYYNCFFLFQLTICFVVRVSYICLSAQDGDCTRFLEESGYSVSAVDQGEALVEGSCDRLREPIGLPVHQTESPRYVSAGQS